MSAAAPASQGRAKRETKQVERMTIEVKEKDPEDFKIKAGAGKKLGDIENIVFKIGKHNAASEELKQLHRACFGRAGSKNEIKKNLREFSGFVCADMAAEKAKKVALIGKLDLKQVKSMLDTCDCPLAGTKAECVERLVDFLEKPDESGKKSLVEKAGEKRKRAEKKKEKVTKKATKGKGKATKAAAPKQERAKTAYQLYCDSRREKVKAENPDASFGELTKILAEKWKGDDDEAGDEGAGDEAEGGDEEAAAAEADDAEKEAEKEDAADDEGEAKGKADDMEE